METDSSLKLGSLLAVSFTRAKERFPSFLIASILSWLLIALLVIIGVVFYGLMFGIIPWGSSTNIVRTFVVVVFSIAFVLMFFYLISWTSITLVQAVISPKRVRVIEAFKKTLPLVKGYVWYLAAYSLFTLAILPLGILSLFVIMLLWAFWSSFSVFVYLEKKKNGLENLWESKSLIDQKFWAVAGRLFLMFLASIVVSTLLQSLGGESDKFNVYFILMFVATLILQIFIQAFQISFSYEIYKRLPKLQTVKRAENWIWFGLASWVIIVILTVIYFTSVFKNISL